MQHKDIEKKKEASRKHSREWRRRNNDLVNDRVRQDRLNNPEKYREYDRKKRKRNLKRERLQDILSKRKINEVQYETLFEEHGNKCGICFNEETKKGRSGDLMPLSVDHCHKCIAHIRGLLCHDCNTAIGKAKDDIDVIRAAISYLKKYHN